MTGADFYTYILQTFKRTDKSTEIYNAITDIVMDIKIGMKAEDFKTIRAAAEISVLGNYTFAVQSDFGHLIGDITLVNPAGGSWDLIKVSKETWDKLYPQVAETTPTKGSPKHYCLYGNNFYIGPIPDKTTYKYQYNYTQEAATAIVSGTTNVPFTTKYRQYVKDMVLARLYIDLDDDDKAAKYKLLGEEGKQKIIQNELYNTDAPAFTRYQGV